MYVDPCRAFRTEEGFWYDEVTGKAIRKIEKEDGTTINIQEFLENLYRQAIDNWHPSMKTCGGNNRSRPKTKPTKEPAKPKIKNKEMDVRASGYVQAMKERRQIMRRLATLMKRRGSILRLKRKFGGDFTKQLDTIGAKMQDLRERQSEIDKRYDPVSDYAEEEVKWVNRWGYRGRPIGKKVLLHRRGEHIFEISNDGLKLDGLFVVVAYGPNWKKLKEYAHKHYKIREQDWVEAEIPIDRIGKPLRRHGKKNANGRRIRSRADQKKYAESVRDTARALRGLKVSVTRMAEDEELRKKYEEEVEPKLNKK